MLSAARSATAGADTTTAAGADNDATDSTTDGNAKQHLNTKAAAEDEPQQT